jgi:hypothetical protein
VTFYTTRGDIIERAIQGGHIWDILGNGTPRAREALFEALIHKVTIQADDSVTPVFELPHRRQRRRADPRRTSLHSNDANQAVRVLPRMVGDTGIEPVTSSV